MTASKITCPSCRRTLRSKTEVPAGARVTCPECGHSFKTGAADGPKSAAPVYDLSPADKATPKPESRPPAAPRPTARPAASASVDDEADETAPVNRKSGRRFRDEDEEETPAPAGRTSRAARPPEPVKKRATPDADEEPAAAPSTTTLALIAGGAALVVASSALVIILLVMTFTQPAEDAISHPAPRPLTPATEPPFSFNTAPAPAPAPPVSPPQTAPAPQVSPPQPAPAAAPAPAAPRPAPAAPQPAPPAYTNRPTNPPLALDRRPEQNRFVSRPDDPAARVNGLQVYFEGWEQDLERAKHRAAAEKKDLFILFTGSDWCSWSIRLGYEVTFQAEFRQQVEKEYVLVVIDFPRRPENASRVHDARQNAAVRDFYAVTGYPTVVLAGPDGSPYAFDGYQEGGVPAYLERLERHQRVRTERDARFRQVELAEGPDKLAAALVAMEFLSEHGLVTYYRPVVHSWTVVSNRFDPANEKGINERFFEVDWRCQLREAQPSGISAMARAVVALDAWKSRLQFKDANRAASMHLLAAQILLMANRPEDAGRYVRDGLAYEPSDEDLRRQLQSASTSLGVSSGTGFVVSADGYMLTNHHVIKGGGRIIVRVPKFDKPVPADVVAVDPQADMALLRLQLPEGYNLPTVHVGSSKTANRGQKVAVLGYPLGDAVGSGLKLTTGVVSATPEPGTKNMLVLDAKVNPGNSGGPLCDAAGNVIGMVTAKSLSSRTVESYGMAVPAPILSQFLSRNLPGYVPANPLTKSTEWDEVDRLVSPSVYMVLQTSATAGLP